MTEQKSKSRTIHKYQYNCIRIENLLSIDEQIKLWKHVTDLSSHYKETQARNSKSNFRKIINIGCKTKKWKNKIPQIFCDIINKGCNIASNESNHIPSTFNPEYITSFKYPLKDGKLTGHVDRKKSWVVLISLGQSCMFHVNAPQTNGKIEFEFKSGDCLIFDGSQKANIYHGITRVCNNTIPTELKSKYPDLCNWRASVQMRVYGDVEIANNSSNKNSKDKHIGKKRQTTHDNDTQPPTKKRKKSK
eukprot:344032_1